MNPNISWTIDKKIETTIENLKHNHINAKAVSSLDELHDEIKKLIQPGQTVSAGGSMTLFETGVIDLLSGGDYNYLDRYAEGLKPEDLREVYVQSFNADAYFTSSNALTMEGHLYNIDGNGNRVAAMIYGPKKVIVIVGKNKIVKDLEAAETRLKHYAAPANARRLHLKTPCAAVGFCEECSSPDRICSDYVIIKKQRDYSRMHVFILKEDYGF